jgi:hypothetical protein
MAIIAAAQGLFRANQLPQFSAMGMQPVADHTHTTRAAVSIRVSRKHIVSRLPETSGARCQLSIETTTLF